VVAVYFPVEIARRSGANLARAARRVMARAMLPRRGGFWVVVRLGPGPEETAGPRLSIGREPGLSLLDVLDVFETASSDPRVIGVVLRFEGTPGGWSKIQSLRRAVQRVRERGKQVVAYADTLDAPSLLLASAASRIWLPETGSVFLVGLRLEGLFLKGLLDHLSIRPEVLRLGSHKSAADRFTRDHMSAEEREQLEALADDLFEALCEGIASGRGIPVPALRERIDRGPYTARGAIEAGLVDACLYPDEVDAALEALAPGATPEPDGETQRVEAATYHALRASDPGWRPLLRELPRVAYVVARGAVHRGEGPRGIPADGLRGLLEGLRREERVRGVVLRIDSPGGDALASDLLWRSISVVSRDKPVVVSMGDVVASGGYYMAAGADALFAEAATVTGSIGVVGGKVNVEGLYQRVGVVKEAIERGARAGMLSETRGFTPDERKAVREGMASIYESFLDRVARGRGMSREDVERAAQGRLWSGTRARGLGLVDALGGPHEALGEVRRRAGLSPDERVLVEVHPRASMLPNLRALSRLLRGRARLV
jgi:protease-4